jgi:valyl-tRNA synthetase
LLTGYIICATTVPDYFTERNWRMSELTSLIYGANVLLFGGIRTIRLQKNIAQKETLELQVVDVNPVATFNPVITKLCNLSSIEAVENKADGSGSFMVGTTEYAIPLGNLINTEEELAKLEADLKYQEGFLQSVLKKLSNEKFVSKAPANVIDMERKKQADAESKIASLKESIAALKK